MKEVPATQEEETMTPGLEEDSQGQEKEEQHLRVKYGEQLRDYLASKKNGYYYKICFAHNYYSQRASDI